MNMTSPLLLLKFTMFCEILEKKKNLALCNRICLRTEHHVCLQKSYEALIVSLRVSKGAWGIGNACWSSFLCCCSWHLLLCFTLPYNFLCFVTPLLSINEQDFNAMRNMSLFQLPIINPLSRQRLFYHIKVIII